MTSTSGGIRLSWTDNSTGEQGYRVDRSEDDGPFIAFFYTRRSPFVDAYVLQGHNYSYKVSPFRTKPSGFTFGPLSSASAVVVSQSTPFSLSAERVANGVQLNWTLVSPRGKSGLKVERSTNGGPFVELYRGLIHNQSAYLDTSALPAVSYAYRVRSFEAGVVNWPYSNTVTVAARPPFPGEISAELSATNPQTDLTLVYPALALNRANIYIANGTGSFEQATFFYTDEMAAGATNISGLTPGATYTFYVTFGFMGTADETLPSNPATVTMASATPTPTPTPTSSVPAPTNLVASPPGGGFFGGTTVTLNFDPPAGVENAFYQVFVSVNDGPFVVDDVLGGDASSGLRVFAGNTDEVRAYYVVAHTAEGPSSASNTATLLIPNIPIGLSAERTAEDVTLNIVDPFFGDTVSVFRSTDNATFLLLADNLESFFGSSSGRRYSFNDATVEPDTTYYYKIIGSRNNSSSVVMVPAVTNAVASVATRSISVAPVRKAEGNSGSTRLKFTLSLSAPQDKPVSVDVWTQDGTATAGSDYVALDTQVTFAPGETRKSVTVTVNGDKARESDETFTLHVEAPDGFESDTATGTILNDD